MHQLTIYQVQDAKIAIGNELRNAMLVGHARKANQHRDSRDVSSDGVDDMDQENITDDYTSSNASSMISDPGS